MSDFQNAIRKVQALYQKRWIKICGGIAVILPVLYLAALFGAKSYLTKWFTQNGADSAAIEKLWFNPFTTRLNVQGLDVQSGGKSLFKHSDLVIDLGVGAILKKDIKVEFGGYSDLILDLEQFQDGTWRIGSYTLPAEESQGEPETAEKVASAWAFFADFVHLENCTISLKTPELDLNLLVKSAELEKLTTRTGKPSATFTLDGELNGKPLSITLSRLQLVPFLEMQGEVRIDSFDFGELSVLLHETLPTFAGELNLAGALDFKIGDGEQVIVQYDGDINIVNSDIGGDGFDVQADSLGWQGAVTYRSGGEMTIQTDGLLAVQNYSLSLPDGGFETSEAVIELEGKSTVTLAENLGAEYDGSLLIKNAAIVLPGNEIKEEQLSWQGSVVYDSNHQGEGQYVTTDGMLELGLFSLLTGEADKQIRVGHDAVDWKGVVAYGQKGEGTAFYVNLAGNMGGKNILTYFAETGMTLTQDSFSLTTDSQLVFGDQFDIQGINSLILDGFGIQDQDMVEIGVEKLVAENLKGEGNQTLRLQGLISTGCTVAVPGNMPLDIMVPKITLSGFATDDLTNFSLDQFTLSNPAIIGTQNNQELLQLQDITVDKLTMDEDVNVAASKVTVDSLTLLKGDASEKSFLTLSEASLTNMSWGTEKGFSGDKLSFEHLVTTLIRDKEGALNISRRLEAMSADSGDEKSDEVAAEDDGESAERKSPPIRIREINIKGDSHVHFEDYTLAKPYITDLAFDKVLLKGLDSANPATKSPLVIKATLDDRAPLSISGDISPFLQPIALDMEINLKNYPLSKLSSYTVQAVGTALASGQLHLTSDLKLADDQIDMDNTIVLRKLETETISKELAAELNNQLPIPLDTALSLLRDSDRSISLEIPLKGPVNHLSVGVSDVLITALGKTIVPAATGYVMYALGPYGALAYVGMKVGEKMLKVELPPVTFVPGDSAIADDHREYLERVAMIMEGRPETDIQLCPKVVSWEFMDEEELSEVAGSSIEITEEDREKLVELGQQRAKAVQRYLVKQYGIDATRLLICDTLVETDRKKVPAVMLQL